MSTRDSIDGIFTHLFYPSSTFLSSLFFSYKYLLTTVYKTNIGFIAFVPPTLPRLLFCLFFLLNFEHQTTSALPHLTPKLQKPHPVQQCVILFSPFFCFEFFFAEGARQFCNSTIPKTKTKTKINSPPKQKRERAENSPGGPRRIGK